MNIIILAWGFFFMIPVYFIRLLMDARKLRNGLCEQRTESSREVQEREEPLIRLDYAMWTAPPFYKIEAASGSYSAQFYPPDIEQIGADEESGRILESAIEPSPVTSSRTPPLTNGRKRASRRQPAGPRGKARKTRAKS